MPDEVPKPERLKGSDDRPSTQKIQAQREIAAKDGKVDPFWIESVFPSAGALLTTVYPSRDKIIKNCIFILDANTLLAPFLVGKKSMKEVEKVLRRLAKEDRLLLPAQAVREYAKNRATKIGEAFLHVKQRLSKLQDTTLIQLPMFEDTAEFKALDDSTKKLADAVKEYKNSLNALQERVRDWNFNDPITMLYGDIFTADHVVDHSLTAEEVLRDLARRQMHEIPPGYKDRGKLDGGIGDVVIWLTILRVGKERKQNVVFVTNEMKPDWMVNHGEESLFPRFELVEEFHRTTGHHFTILGFDKFLENMGADAATVDAVALAGLLPPSIAYLFKPPDGLSLTEVLTALEDILRSFVTEVEDPEDTPVEYNYIDSDRFAKLIKRLRDILEKEKTTKTRNGPLLLRRVSRLLPTLEGMVDLNEAIRYQAYRYKSSMVDEQEELVRLATHALRLIERMQL